MNITVATALSPRASTSKLNVDTNPRLNVDKRRHISSRALRSLHAATTASDIVRVARHSSMEPLSSSRPQHDAAASRRRGGSGAGFELEVHEDSAPAGWDSAVRAQRGVVFHTEAWASHKTSGGDGEPVFCTWRDLVSGEVAARALAIRRPPRATRAGKLVSKLAFNSPPVGIGAGSDFVSPLERWARGRATLIQVTLGSFDATSEWAPTVLPHPQRRSEYVLPAGGEADVWENMRGRARRGVKQASKTGVECRAVVEPAALREFAEVYRTTNERLEMLKALPPSHLHVGRFVDSLTALLERDQGRVYAATRDLLLDQLGDRRIGGFKRRLCQTLHAHGQLQGVIGCAQARGSRGCRSPVVIHLDTPVAAAGRV